MAALARVNKLLAKIASERSKRSSNNFTPQFQ